MRYESIRPGLRLMPYIKCYYIYESDSVAAFDDTVFPSGCMELIFNLGQGHWQTLAGDRFVTNPAVELWGQITNPLPIRSVGKNTMLGVRFFPHAASCFFPEKIGSLNNLVIDARDIANAAVHSLHTQLLETAAWPERIALVEGFLLRILDVKQKDVQKVAMIGDVMTHLQRTELAENIENLAGRQGITSRYLQKIFLQHTGLTPKLYSKIHRFQQSLSLIGKEDFSLTSIAYDCGYFDQSHFIREFKSFTGHTPSSYRLGLSPVTTATLNQ